MARLYKLSQNIIILFGQCDQFYRQYGVNEIEHGLEKSYSRQSGIKMMTTKHCIRYANGMCSKKTGKKATPLILSNEKGTFRLKFDCRNCQMNVFSISQNAD